MRYFPGQLLTADDLAADQSYFLNKLRRHNRFLHGWGVVCGLEVTAAPNDDEPWRILIGSGYALGPYGDEIFVPEPFPLNLAACGPGAATDPCEPSMMRRSVVRSGGDTVYVAIKYAECLAKPVQVMPAGCACAEEDCEFSRIRDSFEIECLTSLPASHLQDAPSLCEFIRQGVSPPCPPCPDEPWVVLAEVTLPGQRDCNVEKERINNMKRRRIFSTALLQEQLIDCCCEKPFNIDKVEFLDASDIVVGELIDPSTKLEVKRPPGQRIHGVKVTFSSSVNASSVATFPFGQREPWYSFLVSVPGSSNMIFGERTPVEGVISCAGKVVTFTPRDPFATGEEYEYRVFISGEDSGDLIRPIRSNDGFILDGEPVGLPSGDGQQGGNFEFDFVVV